MPTVFTLPTRPWSSLGTARCRIATEVVPHTKACSPKTKKMVIATAGVVVSASPEVRERLDDQADAHDVAEAHPSGDPPVRDRPDEAPGRRDGRDQPEADVSQPEALAGVEDQHRPGCPEGDVEDEDRQHQRSDGGVVPHPAEALGDLVADRSRTLRVAAVRR